MASLLELLNRNNGLNLNYNPYQEVNQQSLQQKIFQQQQMQEQQAKMQAFQQNLQNPNMQANNTSQEQQQVQQPMIDPRRPVISPELEQAYKQSIQQQPKGKLTQTLEKYGFTPGVITQMLGGITALTGVNPYISSALAQQGNMMTQQEQAQEQNRQAALLDQYKTAKKEQSDYDLAMQKAQEAANLKGLDFERDLEKQNKEFEFKKMLNDLETQNKLNIFNKDIEFRRSEGEKDRSLRKLIANMESNRKNTLEMQKNLGGISQEQFNREQKLNQDYVKALNDMNFEDIVGSYGRMQASVKNPSAAGDLSLIFNYMKMLDPNSVVRESEFATAANAGGIDDRTRALYNKVLKGERLSASMRKDFIERANELYNNQAQIAENLRKNYLKQAKEYGINGERVAPDRRYTGERYVYKNKKQKQINNKKNNTTQKLTKQDENLLNKYSV